MDFFGPPGRKKGVFLERWPFWRVGRQRKFDCNSRAALNEKFSHVKSTDRFTRHE